MGWNLKIYEAWKYRAIWEKKFRAVFFCGSLNPRKTYSLTAEVSQTESQRQLVTSLLIFISEVPFCKSLYFILLFSIHKSGGSQKKKKTKPKQSFSPSSHQVSEMRMAKRKGVLLRHLMERSKRKGANTQFWDMLNLCSLIILDRQFW